MEELDRKTAPKFQEITDIGFQLPEKKTLSNGIPVFQYNLGSQELVKVEFVFEAGTKYQLKPLVASFANAMLKEGTKKKNSLEIANAIDYYGAFLETEVNSDFGTVSLYTLNKHLGKVLPILKEILTESIFPKREFKQKLSIKKQKFLINQEKVETLASMDFSKLIYKGTKYAQHTELSSFDKISVKDCVDFYQNFYDLNNATIFVAGKIDASLNVFLEDLFGKEKLEKKHKEFTIGESTYLASTHSIIKPEAIQTSFRIGKPTLSMSHPDFSKLKVMNTLFGGYFGSRLMTNIREEKGYTYGIGSALMSKIDGTSLIIYTEVGKEVTQPALDEIRKEITKLQTELVSQEELTKVKNYMLGSLLQNTDGAFDMLERFKSLHYHNLPKNYYAQYMKDIHATSPEDILTLAQTHLTEMTIVAAGSVKVK